MYVSRLVVTRMRNESGSPIVSMSRYSHVRESAGFRQPRCASLRDAPDAVLSKKGKAERSVTRPASDNRVTTSGVRGVFFEPHGVPTEPICTHLD